MKRHSFVRPDLELLEDRWVPATARLVGGILQIIGDNAANTIAVTSVAANKVKVVVDGSNLGTYPVGSLLSINSLNGADTVTVDLTAGNLSGNMLVSTGLGSDTFSLDGGTVGGNLTVLNDLGDDAVDIGGAAAVTIGGNATVVGGLGADSFSFGNASRIGGTLALTQTNTILFGFDGTAVRASNVSISTWPESIGDLVIFGAASIVDNNVTYSSGNGSDSLTLNGTIGGNATISSAAGTDSLDATTLILAGNLSYNGGGGDDSVIFGATTFIAGNATLNMGEGTNDLTGLAPAFNVLGNMTITSGNTAIDIDFGGTVGGNLNVTLGNGGNDFEQITGSTIGGTLRLRTGNGDDNVLLNGSVSNLVVFLGAGADTLTLDILFTYGNAYLDFGVDADVDTLVVNMPAGLNPNTTIVNYP